MNCVRHDVPENPLAHLQVNIKNVLLIPKIIKINARLLSHVCWGGGVLCICWLVGVGVCLLGFLLVGWCVYLFDLFTVVGQYRNTLGKP